jgi:hypothetical protein
MEKAMIKTILVSLSALAFAAGAANAATAPDKTKPAASSDKKADASKKEKSAPVEAKASKGGGSGTYAPPKHPIPYADLEAYLKASPKERAAHGW